MNLLNVLLMLGGSGGEGSEYSPIFMVLAIVVIFYFFMIRPQSKKAKKEKEFREALQRGQKVITIGGIHGKIADVKETSVVLNLGNDIKIEVEKSAVAIDLTNTDVKQ